MAIDKKVTPMIMRQMRRPLVTLIITYAISIMGFVLIPGIDDQGKVWEMSFFHAFYMVSYTATTIGYGEIPYPLTEAQRFWAVISMYMTVIAWFYSFGKIIALIQDDAFKKVLTESRFIKDVSFVREPFYLICGFGDTGKALVRDLSERNIRAVVLDNDEDNINHLILQNYPVYVPGILADVSDPHSLVIGGIQHPMFQGAIALTNNDEINQQVAITTKLLSPNKKMICRADSEAAVRNLESIKTDFIIDPFLTFSDTLSMSLQSPALYLLYDWLTGIPDTPLTDPPYPPRGLWIICGFGRFGEAVYHVLRQAGMPVTVIEKEHHLIQHLDNHVHGLGTEEITLKEAGIDTAVAIVAGTANDADNLSILMTALAVKQDLFVIARQNKRKNRVMFESIQTDIVMQPGEIIARKIRMILTIPMLTEFVSNARIQDNEWANIFISRLCAVSGEVVPYLWALSINETRTFAVNELLGLGRKITLGDLQRNPHERDHAIPCIPLLVLRGDQEFLLPEDDLNLMQGDEILFCGGPKASSTMEWSLHNLNTLNYVATGELGADCYVWRYYYYKLYLRERRLFPRQQAEAVAKIKCKYFHFLGKKKKR